MILATNSLLLLLSATTSTQFSLRLRKNDPPVLEITVCIRVDAEPRVRYTTLPSRGSIVHYRYPTRTMQVKVTNKSVLQNISGYAGQKRTVLGKILEVAEISKKPCLFCKHETICTFVTVFIIFADLQTSIIRISIYHLWSYEFSSSLNVKKCEALFFKF